MLKKNVYLAQSPCVVESLESRQFLSATPAVASPVVEADAAVSMRPQAAVATKTLLTSSSAAPILGQTVTFSVVVKTSTGAAVRGGIVELLNAGKTTGLSGTVTHTGHVSWTFDAGAALYVGNYSLGARYLGTSTALGSKTSRSTSVAIQSPTLTTKSDGLQVASVSPGSGAGAATGQSVTVQYTGFFTSNGSVFDSSSRHAPGTFTYTVNATPEQVIAGFDEGTTGIKVGETRVLVIPSALGYKDGQTRVFIIRCVAIA